MRSDRSPNEARELVERFEACFEDVCRERPVRPGKRRSPR